MRVCKKGHSISGDNIRMHRGYKECRLCENERARVYYHTHSEYNKKVREVVKQHQQNFPKQHNKNNRNWRSRDPEWKRLCNLLWNYNLTLDEYHAMQERQDFHCLFCDSEEKLEIDHCHKTNKVRGLLCHRHNVMLGQARDNPEVLRSAANYVEKYNG